MQLHQHQDDQNAAKTAPTKDKIKDVYNKMLCEKLFSAMQAVGMAMSEISQQLSDGLISSGGPTTHHYHTYSHAACMAKNSKPLLNTASKSSKSCKDRLVCLFFE